MPDTHHPSCKSTTCHPSCTAASSDTVTPYTDAELRRNFPYPEKYKDDYRISMHGASHSASCAGDAPRIVWLDRATHRLLATIQEDRRKLTTAVWAMRKASGFLLRIDPSPETADVEGALGVLEDAIDVLSAPTSTNADA